MLTKEQYEILCNLRDGISVDEDAHFELLTSLAKLGYVRGTNYKPHNFWVDKKCDFKITEKGKSACEEYEKSLRQEDREIRANQIATRSNRISIAAIITSAVAAILSIAIPLLIKYLS